MVPRPLCVPCKADTVSCASAEGLHRAGGAAAAGRGALAGLHHLPVRGVRHHAQQHGRALPCARLPHLHLPQGGKTPDARRPTPARRPGLRAPALQCLSLKLIPDAPGKLQGVYHLQSHQCFGKEKRTSPPSVLLFTKDRFSFMEFTQRETAPPKRKHY